MTPAQLKELRCLCQITMIEVLHLKKLLKNAKVIPKDADKFDIYQADMRSYLAELDSKYKVRFNEMDVK